MFSIRRKLKKEIRQVVVHRYLQYFCLEPNTRKVSVHMKRFRFKKLMVLLVFLLSVIMLSGCSSTPLNEEIFVEEEVREKSEIIIELTLDDDYEAIWEYYSEDAKGKVLKEDFIGDMTGYLADVGAFKKITSSQITGYEHEERAGEYYAVAAYVIECENESVQYNIYFNDQMELAGLAVSINE